MKNTLAILFLFAIGFACSDDDAVQQPEAVDFVENYLGSLVIRDTQIDAGDYEFGIGFRSSIAGDITHFSTALPMSGQYRVTLWDSDTEAVLVTSVVDQVEDNTKTKEAINNYSIQANKEYYITVQADNWHEWSSDLQSSNPVIPFTNGSYTITRYGWDFTTTQSFPDSFRTDYIAGAVSFDFQPEL